MSDNPYCVICILGKDYFIVREASSDEKLYKTVPIEILENGEKLAASGFITYIGDKCACNSMADVNNNNKPPPNFKVLSSSVSRTPKQTIAKSNRSIDMNNTPKPTSSSTPFNKNHKKRVEFADEHPKNRQRSLNKQFNSSNTLSQTNRSNTLPHCSDENAEQVDANPSHVEITKSNKRPPFIPIFIAQKAPIKKRSYLYNFDNTQNDPSFEFNKSDLDLSEGDIANENEQVDEENLNNLNLSQHSNAEDTSDKVYNFNNLSKIQSHSNNTQQSTKFNESQKKINTPTKNLEELDSSEDESESDNDQDLNLDDSIEIYCNKDKCRCCIQWRKVHSKLLSKTQKLQDNLHIPDPVLSWFNNIKASNDDKNVYAKWLNDIGIDYRQFKALKGKNATSTVRQIILKLCNKEKMSQMSGRDDLREAVGEDKINAILDLCMTIFSNEEGLTRSKLKSALYNTVEKAKSDCKAKQKNKDENSKRKTYEDADNSVSKKSKSKKD